MAQIEKYEDLEVWKLAMGLCSNIYIITNKELFLKDFALRDQIRRSSISVPSNIAEGFERGSKKQFIYFLLIAKGSCGELRTQLKIAFMQNYINATDFETINEMCLTVSKQLYGFINYLKQYKNSKS